jgi:hypothetical protein
MPGSSPGLRCKNKTGNPILSTSLEATHLCLLDGTDSAFATTHSGVALVKTVPPGLVARPHSKVGKSIAHWIPHDPTFVSADDASLWHSKELYKIPPHMP